MESNTFQEASLCIENSAAMPFSCIVILQAILSLLRNTIKH